MRALFLTWDGPQQSYLESLFFPIFAGLRSSGVEIHVLQFTWATDDQLAPTRAAAERFGIGYQSHRTARQLGIVGNAADVAQGALLAARVARRIGANVLFPRSLLPASIALLARPALPGVQLVFDADGLMADERVDFGGWSRQGPPYRLLRAVEAACVRRASSVITRTQAAKRILVERARDPAAERRIFIVPNAKDPTALGPGTQESRAAARQRHGVADGVPWIVYVGSIGPQYQPVRMFQFFGQLLRREPAARFHLFTFQEPLARKALAESGVATTGVRIERATPEEMAGYLGAADAGLALRTESFSQRAVSPIKVAEYLLAGVPVVSTRVGDLSQQLGGEDVGHLLDDTGEAALEAAANWVSTRVLPERVAFRSRARAVGERLFGLPRCVAAYAEAFELAREAESAPA